MAAWLSLGSVAVTDALNRTRVGILPPLWVLVLAVAIAVGLVARLRPSARRVMPLALVLLLWLPWLPGRLPAAFLIWTGPVVWLVWGAVAAGLAAPALKSISVAAWLTNPRRSPLLAACLAALCYLVGAAALQEHVPDGDEPHYLVITQSLLGDGDLRIENNHARFDYAPYLAREITPDYLRRGVDGEIYSIHAPGVSVAVLPAFAAAGYPGAVLTILLVVAVSMAGLWVVAWQMTSRAGAAWVAWTSVALTTPLFFHSFTIFPDGAGAACVVAGLWLLVTQDMGRRAARPALFAVSAALACLPWLHTRFSIVAGLLGAAIVLRMLWPGRGSMQPGDESAPHRFADAAIFLAVPSLAAIGWFGYFWTIWGTPNPAAPYGGYTQSSLANIGRGLTGLLADQQFGLLTSAPIYLGAIAGMIPLAQRRPRLATELAVVVVVYTMAVASYQMWWGGFSAPARFLVVILPAAALPLAALWQACRTNAARSTMLALLALSVALVLPRVFADDGRLLYNVRDGHDLPLDWANRSVNLPLAFPSVHRGATGAALTDVAIWMAASVVCLAVSRWIAVRRGGAWPWTCLGLAASAMLAATLAWPRHDVGTVTPGTSTLNLLRAWRPGWHTVGWESRPWRMLDARDVPLGLRIGSNTRGPRDLRDAPLFAASLVPAGDYELLVAGSDRPSGELLVMLGDRSLVLDRIGLEGHPAGATGLVVHLPVPVRSLVIRGDEQARHAVSHVELQPRRLRSETATGGKGFALTGTSYGRARVFFMDGGAFMEPDGFWTRAQSRTRLAIEWADAAPPPALLVRAGAIETTAEVASDGWHERLLLSPGEERHVQLPAPGTADVWLVEIVTGAGFRPGHHDPANEDMRNLGVWITPN